MNNDFSRLGIKRHYGEDAHNLVRLAASMRCLGANIQLAGALETARQQGMRDMLDEIGALELQFAEEFDAAIAEEVTNPRIVL